MSLISYRIARRCTSSNPRTEMLREKELQVKNLYDLAVDREDNVMLNNVPFHKSPRIFDRKFIDTFHHKIIVETVCPDDWMECGDYLEYDGMVWLCLNSYVFHQLYCRATFMSCDWQVFWINENGEIKCQYVIDQNNTQYNSGETSSSVMTLGATQHMLRMQCNPDTVLLDSPVRFAIDRNLKKPTCYKVTQNDNSSYNYGKGLCSITVMEVAFNANTDKLITLPDHQKVWICDYIKKDKLSVLPAVTDIKAVISGNRELKVGFYRSYKVTFSDKEGKEIPWESVNFKWNINCNFDIGLLNQETVDNTIKISVKDEELIGSSFLLCVTVDNKMISQINVNLTGRW